MKREQKLQQEIKDSCKQIPRCMWVKIPDSPIFSGNMARFSPKKPFDAFLIIRGKVIAVELKCHHKHTAWPLSSIRPHQIENLLNAIRAGIDAEVWVQKKYKDGLGRKINIINVYGIEQICGLINLGIKSISSSNPGKYCIERIGKYWNIERADQ